MNILSTNKQMRSQSYNSPSLPNVPHSKPLSSTTLTHTHTLCLNPTTKPLHKTCSLPRPSAQLSHMELSQKFYEAMKACASIESTPIAQKLHAQLIFTGLDSFVFLQNHLLHLYSNCNLIDDACWVFNNIESIVMFLVGIR